MTWVEERNYNRNRIYLFSSFLSIGKTGKNGGALSMITPVCGTVNVENGVPIIAPV